MYTLEFGFCTEQLSLPLSREKKLQPSLSKDTLKLKISIKSCLNDLCKLLKCRRRMQSSSWRTNRIWQDQKKGSSSFLVRGTWEKKYNSYFNSWCTICLCLQSIQGFLFKNWEVQAFLLLPFFIHTLSYSVSIFWNHYDI